MEPPILSNSPNAPDGPESDLITDSDTDNFIADVIEASNTTPVIVDFWAPWCGPCKQLTPMLEKAVHAAGGAVRMVKVNIDENKALAAQIGVQSIPAVFAFDGGQPVDAFMGAVPESQIKDFIERLAPGRAPEAGASEIAAARAAFETGDMEGAAKIYAALFQQDSTNTDALAGLASCYAEIGDLERAEQALTLAPPDSADHAGLVAVRAKIDLIKMAPDPGEIAALRAKVAGKPGDLQARYDLALVLNAQGERDEAVEQLMAIMAQKSDWNDGAARTLILQFFESWGAQDPATIAGRQSLSSLLFS